MARKTRKEKAREALLACKSGDEVSTEMFEGMGWAFESFLRFASLSEAQANKNLANLQFVLRAADHAHGD